MARKIFTDESLATFIGGIKSYVNEQLLGKSDKDHTHDTYETKEDAQLKFDELTELASTQANWSQNDNTAVDYIQNRTHWVEQEVIEFLPETELVESQAYGENNFLALDALYEVSPPNDDSLVYIITFDGVRYECPAWYWMGEFRIGDARLLGIDDMEESFPEYVQYISDVPFLISAYYYFEESPDWSLPPTEWYEWDVTVRANVEGTKHTITIEYTDPVNLVYHTLDDAFIPESISRVEHRHSYTDLENKPISYVSLSDADYLYNKKIYVVGHESISINLTKNPTLGKTYVIVLYDENGIIYTRVRKKCTESFNIDGFIEFRFYDDEDSYFYRLEQYNETKWTLVFDKHLEKYMTLQIYEADAYKVTKLDEEFIPDTIARKSDLESIDIPEVDLTPYETKEDAQLKYDTLVDAKADWNQHDEIALDYIKNRTHYEKFTSNEIVNGAFEFRDKFDVGYIYSAWLMEDPPETLFKVGDSVTVVFDGVTRDLVVKYEGIISSNGSDNNYDLAENDFFIEYVGSYLCCSIAAVDAESIEHTISITVNSQEIKTLDEKFIPDTIARTQYVEENFALKSDLDNIDLSGYETTENAQTKYDEFSDTIDSKQDALTGTEGQVVQINADGNAIASDLVLITADDIHAICGGSIQYAEEVMF